MKLPYVTSLHDLQNQVIELEVRIPSNNSFTGWLLISGRVVFKRGSIDGPDSIKIGNSSLPINTVVKQDRFTPDRYILEIT
jgi:hypothetical protein